MTEIVALTSATSSEAVTIMEYGPPSSCVVQQKIQQYADLYVRAFYFLRFLSDSKRKKHRN